MPVATLIYDAECAMCRKSALWLMRRAYSSGELEILPCRSPVRHERFPQVPEEACLSAMQLVLPDGRRLSGADAVPELLRRIHGDTRHRGKTPQRGAPESGLRQIQRLHDELQRAVEREEFERAAGIRDDIRRLEAERHATPPGGRP